MIATSMSMCVQLGCVMHLVLEVVWLINLLIQLQDSFICVLRLSTFRLKIIRKVTVVHFSSSNGVTYDNRFQLTLAACQLQQHVFRLHNGSCEIAGAYLGWEGGGGGGWRGGGGRG